MNKTKTKAKAKPKNVSRETSKQAKKKVQQIAPKKSIQNGGLLIPKKYKVVHKDGKLCIPMKDDSLFLLSDKLQLSSDNLVEEPIYLPAFGKMEKSIEIDAGAFIELLQTINATFKPSVQSVDATNFIYCSNKYTVFADGILGAIYPYKVSEPFVFPVSALDLFIKLYPTLIANTGSIKVEKYPAHYKFFLRNTAYLSCSSVAQKRIVDKLEKLIAYDLKNKFNVGGVFSKLFDTSLGSGKNLIDAWYAMSSKGYVRIDKKRIKFYLEDDNSLTQEFDVPHSETIKLEKKEGKTAPPMDFLFRIDLLRSIFYNHPDLIENKYLLYDTKNNVSQIGNFKLMNYLQTKNPDKKTAKNV